MDSRLVSRLPVSSGGNGPPSTRTKPGGILPPIFAEPKRKEDALTISHDLSHREANTPLNNLKISAEGTFEFDPGSPVYEIMQRIIKATLTFMEEPHFKEKMAVLAMDFDFGTHDDEKNYRYCTIPGSKQRAATYKVERWLKLLKQPRSEVRKNKKKALKARGETKGKEVTMREFYGGFPEVELKDFGSRPVHARFGSRS